ncbi:MAG: hypothetical protein MRJ92_00190 [Nitrospira sp.]|nr:hypothetical protein [Nitrospira sp.]
MEMILLQAEVLELEGGPRAYGEGVSDRGEAGPWSRTNRDGIGPERTLHVGDAFVVGNFSGRVRALITDTGKKTVEAGPSVPVEVIGLPGVSSAGDVFTIVKDERVAREIAQERAMNSEPPIWPVRRR